MSLLFLLLIGLVGLLVVWYAYFQWNVAFSSYRFTDGKKIPGLPVSFPLGSFKAIMSSETVKRYGFHRYISENLKSKAGPEKLLQLYQGSSPLLVSGNYDTFLALSKNPNFMVRNVGWANTVASEHSIAFGQDLARWKIYRSIAVKGLMKPSYLGKVAKMVLRHLDDWFELLAARPREEDGSLKLDVCQSLTALTLDVIGEAAFSVQLGATKGEAQDYLEDSRELNLLTTKLNRMPWWLSLHSKRPRFKKLLAKVVDYNTKLIKQRMKEGLGNHEDFIEFFLSAKDPDTGSPFTIDMVEQVTRDLITGGHETTAFTLSYATYLLSLHPEWQEKIRAEAAALEGPLDFRATKRLPVTHSVIKEVMRLLPTAPLNARTTRAGPQPIPMAGGAVSTSRILFSIEHIMRSPENFSSPDQFRPQRWLKPEEEECHRAEAWLPFGSGVRQCLGQRLSLMEGQLILVKLLEKYRIAPGPATPTNPLELRIESGPTVGPNQDMDLRFFPLEAK